MSFRYPLDLQLFAGEKTEKATPKKRQDARKKGQVAKSQDLSGSVVLLSGFLSLLMFGGYMKEQLLSLFSDVYFHRLNMDVTNENVMTMFGDYAVQILLLLAPLLLIVVVMAAVANYAQVGFLLTGEPLKMQLKKLDPIQGFKRIFSMRSLVEFLKSVLKLTIIGFLVYTTIWGERGNIASLGH